MRFPARLKGRENPGWIEPRTVSRTLAALQAALVCCAFSPGHRPPASALGWALPARWAGLIGVLRLIAYRHKPGAYTIFS